MKKLLFILCFIFVVFEISSQVITNINIQGIDCNHTTGYAVVSTDIPAAWLIFKQYDNSVMSYITIQSGTEDSVVLNSCGNVSVEVYNSSSSLPSDDSTFFVSCPMETLISAHENIECHGDSTGMLKEVVAGGIPFDPDGIPHNGDEYYNYSWYKNGILFSSGQNDTILTNLFNGQLKNVPYLLYIEDSNGCIFQPTDSLTGMPDTSFIFQPDRIRIDSIIINSVGCQGDSTGSFEIWVKGGKRFNPDISLIFNGDEYYHYYLLNALGDTVAYSAFPDSSFNFSTEFSPFPLAPERVKFSGLSAGNYIVHIEDQFGCSFDSTIYVMNPDNYTLHISTNPNIICEQDSTWIKIDSVSGGHPNNLEYYWIINSLDSVYQRSGIYTAIIIDLDNSCTDSMDYILTAPNTIYCDVTSTVAECFGENTGSVQVDSIYGGVSPYTIQWGGINTDSLYAGTYTLFIVDSLGCLYIEDHEVFENPDINLNEIIYTPLCHGDANGSVVINISGGTPPLNYFWLNGTGIPDSLFSLTAGTYVVQTTDTLGCNFLDSVVVSEPDDLSLNFGGYTNPLFCNGGQTLINAMITGGTIPYNVVWNTFDTTNQIVAIAGNYNISVTDLNGCIATNQILITEPESLEIINTSFVQASCNIGAIASIVVSGGTLPYSYIWSNGETTSSASDLTEGTQWVIVTDSCGDTATYFFEVESYILETTINHYNNPDNYAEVEILYSTSGSPFSYQWYNENMHLINGETNNIIEDLCPAWYYCITTDANNCESTDSILAELYLPMGGIIDENTTTVYEDSLLWGSEPYTYLWDNGDITSKGNICPGFHRVWVTDVNGCEVVGELTVEDILLTLSPTDIIIECDITNLDVELEIIATGGTGDYTYLWSNGQTDNPINLSLNPGVYSVEVKDDNLCNEDTVFHIAAMSSDCIPNVFSPNDDGSNDVWNLEDAFFYLDSEVRIYNRYGKLVFKSVGYETPWDGKNESGNDVEDGAYFYVIDLANDIAKIKGTVSIIR